MSNLHTAKDINLLEQAIAAHRCGKMDEARQLYLKCIERETDQAADAWALLGTLLSAAGEHDAAINAIERALNIDPAAALFLFYKGNIYSDARRLDEAIIAYMQALDHNSNFAEAYYNLGNAYNLLENKAAAIKAWEQTLELSANHHQALNNLALAAESAGDIARARKLLDACTTAAPDYINGWLNLSRIANSQGEWQLAEHAGRMAMRINPQDYGVFLALGVALNRQERHEEAIEIYHKALALRPDWIEVWDNIGQSFLFLNQLDEAERAYRKTIDISGQIIPDKEVLSCDEGRIGNYHWHLSLLELLRGQYTHGFARYRARFNEKSGILKRPAAMKGVRIWRGEDIRGMTLAVYSEQGLGDVLMMIRWLPMLRQDWNVKVLLFVRKPLLPLLHNWEGADIVLEDENTKLNFDMAASIFDLPCALGIKTPADIPPTPYLPRYAPDPRIAPWAQGRRTIGVVWAGSAKHYHDARRSIPLQSFARLFADAPDDVCFVNLNLDLRSGDREILARHSNVFDATPFITSIADTAKLIEAVDLVITCDTSTAHLGGGMGKPVWTLLPFAPDWRWGLGTTDSAWYSSMRLFRQSATGDWDGLISTVIDEIVNWRPARN